MLDDIFLDLQHVSSIILNDTGNNRLLLLLGF